MSSVPNDKYLVGCGIIMVLPIYDDHLHLSPSGRNIEALKEFKAEGGTGLTLVNLPYPEVQIADGEDFRKAYDITVGFAEKGRELGLKINVALGPYPILMIPLAEHLGLERAESIMMRGMEIAAEYVADGRADLIGEVGRPHFEAPQEIVDACNRVLQYGMDLAHENDCAVMIHCESEEWTDANLADMARSSGMEPRMVVKHSSPPWVTPEETHGVTPSISASRKLIREALSKGRYFMMETDFIDDPVRPTSIMAVTTVPKRVKALHSSGELSEEDVYRMCQDIPESLYGRR